jgi:hypothetical protein
MAKEQRSVIPVARIVQSILRVRGQKVLLDADLAKLYGVTSIASRRISYSNSPTRSTLT